MTNASRASNLPAARPTQIAMAWLLLCCISSATAQTSVFINELHYDNDGGDVGEAIEVAGPAGSDLNGWSIVLYNGSNGSSYNTLNLTGSLTDQCGGLGTQFISLPVNGLQNGSPDGLALVDDGSNVLQFLSYEGSFTATDGPANGLISTDIGVAEPNNTPVGQSLQLTGTGQFAEDFSWTGPVADSFGNCNSGQVFTGGGKVGPLPLLLSEIVVTPTAGEFIEIHNPNGVAVDLNDVYLSDTTFTPDSVFYYKIVTGNLATTGGGDFGDFSARFPDGASIPAGAYQTLALAGSSDFNSEYGIDPDYELFEDDASADAIPDMREALPGSINNQGGLTNSGEVVVLFAWDGASDLVTDLDYVVWGNGEEAVDKTGVSIDGPDADADASSYLDDTAIASQEVVAGGAHASGNSFQRDDLSEGNEVKSGGNGAQGHDETSEDVSVTWCEAIVSPGQPSACNPPPPFVCGEPATPIHAIQGSGFATPLADASVVDVEAVVVGDFANLTAGELGGFFLQEEDAETDADALTSEGIFVFNNSLDVMSGDVVRVRGQVTEFFELTQINNVTDITICSSGASVSPATVTLPLADITDLEAVEGMAVVLPQTLTVSDQFNLVRFGEFTLSNRRLLQPTQTALPGIDANTQQAANDRNRLIVNDGRNGSNVQPFVVGRDDSNPLNAGNPVRNGYQLSGLSGVMNFTFGAYKIEPTAALLFDETANPRQPGPQLPQTPLRVAALNVLNFFSTLDDSGPICGPAGNAGCRGADSATELQRQTDKLVATILAMDADIIGLVEIENNASASLQTLVDALNAASNPATWAFIDTGTIGNDVIKVALIYQPAAVSPVGTFAILDASIDSRFDSSLNRPSLAQTFQHSASGEVLTVDINHLKSKGCGGASGGDADQGDGQACFNPTRTAAAQALADWLVTDPTASGDADYLILGDLNAYSQEDPIRALTDAGLVDIGQQFDAIDEAYSFTFFGQAGALDHAIASPELALQVLDASHWHSNSDEIVAFDYNEENLTGGLAKPADFFQPDVFRAADHDPVVVAVVPGDGVVAVEDPLTELSVDRQNVLADGIDSAIVSLALVNRAAAPVSGVNVSLATTGSAQLAQSSGVTDSQGLLVTSISSTVIEEVLLTAELDLNGDGQVDTAIGNGTPARISFEDPDDFVFADGFE